MLVSRNQLVAMANWLETTEDANDNLADEIWQARQVVTDTGRIDISTAAVREALYYAENASDSDTWTSVDQRAFDQLARRLAPR
jgi:hypothetical protein